MKREDIIAEIKLKWQKHNRDNGLSWNEVAELVNEVAGIDHQKEQEGMSAERLEWIEEQNNVDAKCSNKA